MLVAYYHVRIDEDMILRAIKTAQLDFLYCVFAYNKNYEELSDDSSSSDDESIGDEDTKYLTFTFDFLFKKVLEFCEDQATNRIRDIVHWKIKSSENILKSLLMNNQDKIAWYDS
jgi:hypothetical protein